MSKHTPGPWMVGYWGGRCTKASHAVSKHPGKTGSDPCIYEPEFTAGRYGIGAQNGKMVVSTNYDELVMSAEDANLIAAAPDLLEALQEALHGVEGNHPLDADITSWQEAARAAIAKATGASQ